MTPLERWHAEFCGSMDDAFARWDRVYFRTAAVVLTGMFGGIGVLWAVRWWL